jgi:hypothetical protein
MSYDDFDFGVIQMKYVEINGSKSVGLEAKVDYDSFVTKEKYENPKLYDPVDVKQKQDSMVVDMMKEMM